jgi:hypothetical protein
VIWQTGLNGGDGSAFMFGPSVRWSGPSVSFGVAGGPKLNPGDLDNTWYGRVTLVIQ